MTRFKPKQQKSKVKIVSVEEQLSIEAQRCGQMIAAAETAVKSGNFSQAEELYSACVPIMDQIYASDSKAKADCLAALADVYYWQNKFGMALPLYQNVVGMREKLKDTSPASVVDAYYRLAKTNEHLSNVDSAQEFYKRAADIGQKVLMLGHPLLTSVFESYSNFLRDKTNNQALAEEFSRRARSSKETFIDPQVLQSDLMEGSIKATKWAETSIRGEKDPNLWKNIEAPVSKHWLVQTLRKMRDHPRMTIAFLTLPVSLGVMVVVAAAIYFLNGGEGVQASLVHPKELLHSASDQQEIEILADNRISSGGLERKYINEYITLSNPWRALRYYSSQQNGSDIVLVKRGDSFIAPGQFSFSPGPSKSLSILRDLKRFSNGLHQAATNGAHEMRLGKVKEFCAQFAYVNPYTETKESPNIWLAQIEPDVSPSQLVQYLEQAKILNPKDLSEKGLVKFLGGKNRVTPSLIKCILVPDSGVNRNASFYTVATGEKRTLLKRGDSNKSFVAASIAGGAPLDLEIDSNENFPEKTRIVFAKTSKEDLNTATYMMGWLLLLLPIMLVGYKLFASRSAQSTNNKSSQTDLYLSTLYILALCAYTCFFVGALCFFSQL